LLKKGISAFDCFLIKLTDASILDFLEQSPKTIIQEPKTQRQLLKDGSEEDKKMARKAENTIANMKHGGLIA
jgi:hypothetical protein